MAERASSRTAVRMSIGFMTGGNAASSREVTDELPAATSGEQTRHRGHDERRTHEILSTSLGGRADGIHAADEHSRGSATRGGQPTRLNPSLQLTQAPIPATGSSECWPTEPIQSSNWPINYEPLYAGGHEATNRWVRFAWEPLAGADDGIDSSVPAGACVPGVGGVATPRERLGPPRRGREQFGVKRFRTSDDQCSFDEQGGEAKRVGSPHRLIRRIPANRRDQSPPAYPRHPCIPPPTNAGFNAGAVKRQPTAITDPTEASSWTWTRGGEDSRLNVGWALRQGTGGRAGAGGAFSMGNSDVTVDATVKQGRTPPHVGISGGTACRPVRQHREHSKTHERDSLANATNDSLKVQRLSVGHMDTLTNGVEGLGVISPGVATSTRNAVAESTHLVPMGECAWRRNTRIGCTDDAIPTTAACPRSTGRACESNEGGGRAREAWSTGDGEVQYNADVYGNDESRLREESAFSSTRASFRTTGGHAPSLPAATTATDTRITAKPPSLHPSHAGRDSELHENCNQHSGAAMQKEECAVVDVGKSSWTAASSAHGTETASPRDNLPQTGKGAPGYDAAVSTGRCGTNDGEGSEGAAGGGGASGGDIDDDSSDGGAAHEEISAWLHSTQDWWTS